MVAWVFGVVARYLPWVVARAFRVIVRAFEVAARRLLGYLSGC